MSKSSRAGRKQQSHLRANGAPSRISAMRPRANLATALGLAAESTYDTGVSAAAASSRPSSDERMAAIEPVHARVPAEAEEHFFASGEAIASLLPSEFDIPEADADDTSNRLSAELIERRARMRRIVASVVGSAAMLTVVVATKAWLGRPSASAISESSLSLSSTVVPSIAMTAQQEPAAPVVAPGLAASPPVAESQALQRVPIVDVEIPVSPDPDTNRAWQLAARSVSFQDFKQADRAFAELGKRADPATREAARLARAAWWMANGKQAQVRAVIADLAANATTPSVVKQARELLHTD
jgi:hypothetical protein